MRYGAPWIAGALVYGNTDLGVTGAVIRATTGSGTNGQGLLYNDWDSAADDNKRFRLLYVSGAPAGTLIYEDGSFTVPQNAANGTYTLTYELFVDGVSAGTTTANLVVSGAADSTSPVLSGAMTVGTVTSSSIQVSWPSATDNVGVSSYETSTDGVTWTSRDTLLTYTFSGLTPNTSYTLRVRAKDAAGNSSSALQVTQITPAAADVTAPVMTGTINVSAVTTQSYTISGWGASDNVAITGYEVSLNGGTSWVDNGLAALRAVTGRTPSTTDAVLVRAYDAAGNRSTALSASVTLLTPAPVPAPPPPAQATGTARVALTASGQLVVLIP